MQRSDDNVFCAASFLPSNKVHKSEAGAVRVNLMSADEVAAAAKDMIGALASAGLRLESLVVMEHAPKSKPPTGEAPLYTHEGAGAGVEAILGGVQNPTYGPVVRRKHACSLVGSADCRRCDQCRDALTRGACRACIVGPRALLPAAADAGGVRAGRHPRGGAEGHGIPHRAHHRRGGGSAGAKRDDDLLFSLR